MRAVAGFLACTSCFPTRRSLRPFFVRTNRQRLINSESLCIDISDDEIFRRDRVSGKPAQHSELTRVRHRIGKWTLQ